MTTPTTDTEVDGADQQDHDATEAAIAAIVTALILAWLLPGPISLLAGTARAARKARRQQIADALGYTLSAYIQRSAHQLAAASGQPGASTHAADAADHIYEVVLHRISDWIEDAYQNTLVDTRHGGPPDAGITGDVNPRELAEASGQRIGIGAAIYAENEAREETARRTGALWSIWRTRGDRRVRHSHQHLDRQKVPFGGRFVTADGSAYLRFPGDPEAPLTETAGCRCRLTYRFRPVSLGFGDV